MLLWVVREKNLWTGRLLVKNLPKGLRPEGAAKGWGQKCTLVLIHQTLLVSRWFLLLKMNVGTPSLIIQGELSKCWPYAFSESKVPLNPLALRGILGRFTWDLKSPPCGRHWISVYVRVVARIPNTNYKQKKSVSGVTCHMSCVMCHM